MSAKANAVENEGRAKRRRSGEDAGVPAEVGRRPKRSRWDVEKPSQDTSAKAPSASDGFSLPSGEPRPVLAPVAHNSPQKRNPAANAGPTNSRTVGKENVEARSAGVGTSADAKLGSGTSNNWSAVPGQGLSGKETSGNGTGGNETSGNGTSGNGTSGNGSSANTSSGIGVSGTGADGTGTTRAGRADASGTGAGRNGAGTAADDVIASGDPLSPTASCVDSAAGGGAPVGGESLAGDCPRLLPGGECEEVWLWDEQQKMTQKVVRHLVEDSAGKVSQTD